MDTSKDHEPAPRHGDWDKWLGRKVRVFSMQDREAGGSPFAEGRIISVCTDPTITVEDDQGNRSSWSTELPIRFQQSDWKRSGT